VVWKTLPAQLFFSRAKPAVLCKVITSSQPHKTRVDMKTPQNLQKAAATELCSHLSHVRENEPVTAWKECKETHPTGLPARKEDVL